MDYNNTIINNKIKFSNKFLVYSTSEYNDSEKILSLIKSFKQHTLINYVYGKGNKYIKMYSLEYNHRLLGCELKDRDDFVYLKKGKVECIFVFFPDSYEEQSVTKINLKNFAKINKIPYYENITNITNVNDVLLNSGNSEYQEYSEFDILNEPENNTSINLIRCLEKIKIRDQECRDFKNNKKIIVVNNHNKKNNIYKFFYSNTNN
jgi:hypothetical protein